MRVLRYGIATAAETTMKQSVSRKLFCGTRCECLVNQSLCLGLKVALFVFRQIFAFGEWKCKRPTSFSVVRPGKSRWDQRSLNRSLHGSPIHFVSVANEYTKRSTWREAS